MIDNFLKIIDDSEDSIVGVYSKGVNCSGDNKYLIPLESFIFVSNFNVCEILFNITD
jgi:hypothetical protein